jgi:hypothetical protein
MLCGRENGDINAAEFDGAYGSAAMQKPRIQRTARGDCGGKKDLHSMVVSGDDKPNAHPTMTASSAATNCKRVRLQKQVRSLALCRRSTASGVVFSPAAPCAAYPSVGLGLGPGLVALVGASLSAVLRAASLSAVVGAGYVIAGSLARLSIGPLTCDDLWQIFG